LISGINILWSSNARIEAVMRELSWEESKCWSIA